MKKLEIDQVIVEAPTNGARNTKASARTSSDRSTGTRFPSVIVGRIAALPESGAPLVDFPGNSSGKLVPAQSLIPVTAADTGRNIALTFEDGDPSLPIILGMFQTPATPPQREVKLDDESLVLSAKKEVVIQCGKSSITLTSAGKVLIQGEYVLSRSSGVNKIRGGSIQLN